MLDLLSRSEEAFSPEEKKRVYRELKSSTAMLLEMINQLLNIHRLRAGKLLIQPSVVRLRGVVDQIIMSLQSHLAEKDITVEVDIGDDFQIAVDVALAREAVFNLISNAVKFSRPGSVVRVEAHDNSVTVTDQGIGIPKADIPNLFRHDRKTTRRGTADEPGTGLGLPLVQDIMKAHNGTVSVLSEEGRGTSIVLTFGA